MQDPNTIRQTSKMLAKDFSQRMIRSALNKGAGTIKRLKERIEELKIPHQELEKLSDEKLMELFYPHEVKTSARPLPDFAEMDARIRTRSLPSTVYSEWEDYKREHPVDGYQYSQFKEYYYRWVADNHPGRSLKMHIDRTPGECLYIDWTGDTLPLVENPKDPDTPLTAHFLVTTLGYSSYIFTEAFPDEKLMSVQKGMVDSLEFYGALPARLVPDNMRSAVTKNTRDELVLSALFQDLDEFYDIAVVPAPPRKPKGKATVENAVKWVETYIIRKLKGRTFPTFEDLNSEVSRLLEEMNNRKKGNTQYSRKELFEKVDLPAMRPLPVERFTRVEYARSRVPNNYHVPFDKHYYSVPYTLYHPKKPTYVSVKATQDEIIICDSCNREIARHKRSYDEFKNKYVTVEDHMPTHHRLYNNINNKDSSYYLDWARNIGPDMTKFIQGVIYQSRHEEQSYRSCMGILQMAKRYGDDLAEAAAGECLKKGNLYYTYFKRMLSEQVEKKLAREEAEKQQKVKTQKQNGLRGRGHWRQK